MKSISSSGLVTALGKPASSYTLPCARVHSLRINTFVRGPTDTTEIQTSRDLKTRFSTSIDGSWGR